MAWSQIIGAIVGAAGGAAYGGYTSYRNAKKNADVYKKAALLYGYDTNKYSGENANQSMYSSGMQQGRVQNEGTMNAAAAQAQRGNSQMANALKGAANVGLNNTYDSGYNTGASNAATLNNAAFNRDTALAQQMMNQADINYKRDTALSQAGLNTAAGAADVYKNVVSDENAKQGVEEYTNKEGLPKADADDALRRIESIEFKYKPEMQKEMGLDNEDHVGVTAQSVEDTAFDDMVETGPNGYKQLDKQMMLEATLAGIASLRKELDELESKDNITSDEECKVAEDAIESNPEKAADILPEGSDIQKEAEQAINGGRDAEVNNDAVSKYIGLLNGSIKPDTVITDDGREISRDEYAAEMAQFREDNPEDILREREESKAAAREEAREKRAESNKLADMAKEVADETEEDTTNKDSVGLGFLHGLFNLGSSGSVSDSVPTDTPVNLNNELPEDGVNANFSSGASNSVSAEVSGGETAATITGDATFTDSSDTADKSFGSAIETAQEDAAQLSVNSGSSGGMTAAAGNGGTVSSGATKHIHSKEQKLPSNEERTQDYSNTLSGDEMKSEYISRLNDESKVVHIEGVDSEPEMSTYNGVPFTELDNDALKKLEQLLSNNTGE